MASLADAGCRFSAVLFAPRFGLGLELQQVCGSKPKTFDHLADLGRVGRW